MSSAETTAIPEVTIGECFAARAERYGDRTWLRVKREGRYQDLSWRAAAERVRHFTLGLMELGLQNAEHVALLSENRPEWPLADLAIQTAGGCNVPIYPTNTPAQTEYILRDSGAVIAIASTAAQVAKYLEVRPSCDALRHVIVMDDAGKTDGVLTMSEVEATGAAVAEGDRVLAERLAQVDPHQLASIIYTSGTTGDPKGVMLTHENFLSNARAACIVIPAGDRDVCLSFLPLSHSFERMAGYYLPMVIGATIAYAESVDTLRENMVEVQPTLMASVPRVYEKFYAAVMEQVAGAPPLRQNIFHWALAAGKRGSALRIEGKQPRGLLALQLAVADRLVFRTIRKGTGGRLRYFVSGGAPLAREINEFFHALGITILEGYGLTETAPVLTTNTPNAFRFGTVGQPVPGVDLKIAEDGEILARGPNIMQGYYNQSEATAEVLRDGWFYTGDIGEIDDDGYLKITDRKKDIIVTAGGKNLAPQNIENLFITDAFIAQVMVHGDRRKFPSALIVPDFSRLQTWATEHGLAGKSPEDLVGAPTVQQLFEERVDSLNATLAQYEKIKKFALLPAEFTLESGELTPSLKMKRKVITEKYLTLLDALYD